MPADILGGENSLSATVRSFPEIESLECLKIGAGHLGRVPCGEPGERGLSAVADIQAGSELLRSVWNLLGPTASTRYHYAQPMRREGACQ